MRKKILVVSIFALFILLASFYWQNKQKTKKTPYISKRWGEISVSSDFLNLQKTAEHYRFQIRHNPSFVKNYVQLAQLYLQQARISGRHHDYIAKAQELLDEALSREPKNFEAMITRASIMLKLHRFEKAKELANKAITSRPFNAFLWGVLSDALKELGDYEGAVKACDKMLGIRPDLRSYSRAAHLREIHGDVKGALQAMKLACDAGVVGLENRAWTLHQLGALYLKEGKLDTAEYIYNGILDERPDYHFALSGLAQIRNMKADYESAIQLMLRAYEVAPEHEFMEKIIKIYRALGQTQIADNLVEMVLQAFEQHEAQGWNVNLEFAQFCVNENVHLDDALIRMAKEYNRRPKNIDVLATYAWVLYKNDRVNEAGPLVEQALRLNKKDAKLKLLANKIASKMGTN